MYDVRKTSNINVNYLNFSYNIDKFKNCLKVGIKVQILSEKFKVSKKINVVLTLDKYWQRENK